jgi:hypothetical protein
LVKTLTKQLKEIIMQLIKEIIIVSLFSLLAFHLHASENAEIMDFTPPKGTYERGETATCELKIKNTGTDDKIFWVGLSFAHESTTGDAWPEGWHDIAPKKASLKSGESKTITFTIHIPKTWRSGQYYAVSSIWDDFNREDYLMVKPRYDNTLLYEEWNDKPGLGAKSIYLDKIPWSDLSFLDNYSEFILRAKEKNIGELYHSGKKPIYFIEASADIPVFSYGGISVNIAPGMVLLFDLADLLGYTPEGKKGWTTVWLTETLTESISSPTQGGASASIKTGMTWHEFNYNERAYADEKEDLFTLGELSAAGFTVTGATYNESGEWSGPAFQWNGTKDISLTVSSGSKIKKTFRIKNETLRKILKLAQVNPTQQQLDIPTYIETFWENFKYFSENSEHFSDYTSDDGSWQIYSDQPVKNLTINSYKGYSHHFYINIPENATNLTFTTCGGEGNLDFYYQYNEEPYRDGYNCDTNIYFPGSTYSNYTIEDPKTGNHYIALAANTYVDNYDGYRDVTLTASYKLKNDPAYDYPWTNVSDNGPWYKGTKGATIDTFNNKIWITGGIREKILDFGFTKDTFDVSSNRIYYTSDGNSWNTIHAGWGGRKKHVSTIFKNKLWVFGGINDSIKKNNSSWSAYRIEYNDVWNTSDGNNWTKVSNNLPHSKYDACFTFNNRIYLKRNKLVIYSTDGKQWHVATDNAPVPENLQNVLTIRDKIWLIGSSETWSSRDGKNWELVSDKNDWTPRYNFSVLEFGSKLWITGGKDTGGNYHSDYWSSDAGKSWIKKGDNLGWEGREKHKSVIFNNRIWVLGGSYKDNNDNTQYFQDVWASDTLVSIKLNKDRFKTTQGDTVEFQIRLTAEPEDKMDLYVNRIHGNNQLKTEPSVFTFNNTNWNQYQKGKIISPEDSTPTNDTSALFFKGSQATSRMIQIIEYGEDTASHNPWTEMTEAGPWYKGGKGVTADTFKNKIFVTGGIEEKIITFWYESYGTYKQDTFGVSTDRVYYSSDGKIWNSTKPAWGARENHKSLVYDDKLWIFGGVNDYVNKTSSNSWTSGEKDHYDVWCSSDGRNWTRIWDGLPYSTFDAAFVFNKKMWLKHNGVIINSTNGKNWNTVTKDAPDVEYFEKIITTKGKIWLLAGPGLLSSKDGKTWEIVSESPGWKKRFNFSAQSFDSNLWIMGGKDDENMYYNDYWASIKGKQWTMKGDTLGWKKRENHKSVVFNNRLWILGGSFTNESGKTHYFQDAWASDPILKLDIQEDTLRIAGEDTAKFNIRLSYPPKDSIKLNIARIDGTVNTKVEPNTFTFNKNNWNQYQQVNVMASEDTNTMNDTSEVIISGKATSPKSLNVIQEEITHKLSLSANPAEGGKVSPDSSYVKGSEATIVANPKQDYAFEAWIANGDTISKDSVYTFTIMQDTSITAHFIPEYAVSLAAQPDEGGTVTGDSTYVEGSETTILAKSSQDYAFEAWIADKDTISKDSVYTFTISQDTSITAHFIPEYAVYLGAQPDEGGTVTGDSTYIEGSETTILAKSSQDYAFEAWIANRDTISKDSVYTFTISQDTSITAHFISEYDVSLSAKPVEGGMVTGDSTYIEGTEATIVANPKQDYAFEAWIADEDTISKDSVYTFTVSQDTSISAHFIPEYTVSLTARPDEGGKVSGGGNYPEESEITISAIPNSGYTFDNWTENGNEISTNKEYTFTVDEDRNLNANFSEEDETSLNDISFAKGNIQIYPNPTSGNFTIEIIDLQKEAEIIILNVSGKVVYEDMMNAGENRHQVNLSEYRSGVYFIKLRIGTKVYTKKIILEDGYGMNFEGKKKMNIYW